MCVGMKGMEEKREQRKNHNGNMDPHIFVTFRRPQYVVVCSVMIITITIPKTTKSLI